MSNQSNDPVRRLVSECAERNLSLGAAESLTGGLLGYTVCCEAGAGEVFRGSIVAYHTETKRRLLGVGPGRVVSARAAREMARGARQALGSDIAVSITGVAGPDEQDGMPVGTVFVGVAVGDALSVHRRLQLAGDPDEIRRSAVTRAALFVIEAIREERSGDFVIEASDESASVDEQASDASVSIAAPGHGR